MSAHPARRAARRPERKASTVLRERLAERRAEIEAAALTRVQAIADPAEAADPAYAEGLRGAVDAAVAYGLEAIGSSTEGGPPIPVPLLAQARLAARNAIPLDTVLRRYFAGYSLLGYFMIEEASKDGLMSGTQLQRLLGTQAVIFDRLLAAIGEEHAREAATLRVSSSKTHGERIESLLKGELIDTAEIPYDFHGWHLGLVAGGAGAARGIRELARALDLRPLLVEHEDCEATVWAWLGARCPPDPKAVRGLAGTRLPKGTPCALGEPASGVSGWRLTHHQALAALTVARRGGGSPVHYADVALLASALRDDLLVASLSKLYLEPLKRERDGGEEVMKTLRTFLAAGGNVTSTAATLGVTRHTVANRLRATEATIGRPLSVCAADFHVALQLDRLAGPNMVDESRLD